jgi:integrase/recombinase XerC
MSARVSLQARVEQYLAERRLLGFKLDNMAQRLASFARYVANAGHVGPLTVDLMADWARQAKAGHGDRATLARRLKMLRPFTAWLRQFDPATEVPDEAVFGRVPGRMTPHVYREPEIVELLAAARQLGPEGGLRPAVMETLFGLVACTGLRISEALGLLDADVDLSVGVLTIRQSKFGKTRLVPLHPSAVQALERYRDQRARHVRTTPELPFFVASRGQLLGHPVGIARSTASSAICDANWAGSTGAAMARRASTTCATASPCAGWCCGTSRARTSTSACWRCRPTSATSRSPAPTGISPACRN